LKVIVIGGVAAGMSAASKIKRMQPDWEVVVYEKGDYPSYGACGLPYFVSNVNQDYTLMLIRTKEEFAEAGIPCFLNHLVLDVDTGRKSVVVKNLNSGEKTVESYDKLMIASGADAFIPDIEGKDLKGVYTLKTLNDAFLMKKELLRDEVKKIVVVGGGFIGVELVESMRELGKSVTLVEMTEQILPNFDAEISNIAMDELKRNEVKVSLGEKLISIEGTNKVRRIITDKNTYNADAVILALGVRPNTGFLAGTGVERADNGAVIVDRHMKTNVESVYAAGDCALIYNYAKEKNAYIPLGTTANKSGRIAGDNIAGEKTRFIGTLGSSCIKVFNCELARTGLSESDAIEKGLEYKTVFVESFDRAPYYPDQTPIWIKLIYEKGTKRILGAHAAGAKGVVLRIDIFAVAIQMNMTTDMLGQADFCYAPPYAMVWDAVNIACNAAK
jgi:NADPH-dependent 2,4-dienoyl-CoA reductase/sulfur reductase-like enzyme